MPKPSYKRDLEALTNQYLDDVMIANATMGDCAARYREVARLQRQFLLNRVLLQIEWGFQVLTFDVEAA